MLVNQGVETPTIQKESLVGGIGLIETKEIIEEPEDQASNEEVAIIPAQPEVTAATDAEVNNTGAGEVKADVSENSPVEIPEEEATEELVTECEIDSSLTAQQDTIIFNEIAWMGTSYSAQDEWVELKNISGETIDLEGWQIFDADKNIQIIFEEHITLLSQEFLLLERTDDTTLPRTNADVIYTGVLNNTEETLYLFNKQCFLQDVVKADPDWPAGDATTKESMERSLDMGWHTYNREDIADSIFGTPKKENNLPAPQEPGELSQPVSFEPYFVGSQGQGSSPTNGSESEIEETYLKLLISELYFEFRNPAHYCLYLDMYYL